jgi:hypothetical protein
MSQLMKLWMRVKNNPKTVSFDELDKILRKAGFKRRQPGSGSSHYTYSKDGKILIVPRKQPYVKEEYIKQAIEAIGDCFESE